MVGCGEREAYACCEDVGAEDESVEEGGVRVGEAEEELEDELE